MVAEYGIETDEIKIGALHAITAARTTDIRVLVVEDTSAIRQLIIMMLELEGYHADGASCGSEALQMLIENYYDLVLLDCSMRDMDGFQLIANVRNQLIGVRNSQVPVVAVTGHTEKGYRQRCLDAGMDDFLGKPFLMKELLSLVRLWTERSGTRETSL